MEKYYETLFFENLCKQYYKRIFQYLMVKVHDPEVAADLVQNTFLVAWEKRNTLAKHENPLGFLYVTAQNIAFSYLRQAKKAPTPLPEGYTPCTDDHDLFETIEKQRDNNIDETKYVDTILKTLPLSTKELYQNYYIDKLSISEIAKNHHSTEVAVRMRLVRLRKRIKKEVHNQHLELL
ncbi:MAG: sigma-70 family RNA polymerase sigma factor [Clostridiales bacterium]